MGRARGRPPARWFLGLWRAPRRWLGALLAYPAPRAVRRNAAWSLLEGALGSVSAGVLGSFLGVYVVRLGGPALLVGLSSALPPLLASLVQPWAVRLTARQGARPVMLRWALVARAGLLLLAVVPLLPAPGTALAWALVLAYALANGAATLALVAWTALMARLFPGHLRGRVFGDRNLFVSLTTLLGTLAGGLLLDLLGTRAGSAAALFLGGATAVVSWFFLRRLEPVDGAEAEAGAAAEPVPGREEAPGDDLRLALAALRRPLPQLVFAGGALFQLGLMLPAAAYPIFYVRTLHLPGSWISAIGVGSSVAAIATSRLWGAWHDRRGVLWTYAVSTALFLAVPAVYSWARSPWLLLLANSVTGVGAAGYALANFNAVLAVARPAERTALVALFNLVLYALAALAPMLGTALLPSAGLPGLFLAAGAGRAGGALLFAWARRRWGEPGPRPSTAG
ncbi:MAG: MFS transporter [Bacillota bacterium]|nr:MFS transporter [Bacillota bacterium]